MKRAILFRFHKNFEVCLARLAELKYLNPGVPIFGMFGGTEESYQNIPEALSMQLAHNYRLTTSPEVSWCHGATICVQEWFKNIGRNFSFEVLNLIEWDLLMSASLEQLGAEVPANALGLTLLTPFEVVEKRWWWVASVKHHPEFVELAEFMSKNYGCSRPRFVAVAPGTSYPRAFLEAFVDFKFPLLCNDETQLAWCAEICGFACVDNGLVRRFGGILLKLSNLLRISHFGGTNNPLYPLFVQKILFNTVEREVPKAVVLEEIKRPGGNSAFHPVYQPLAEVLPLLKTK